MKTLLIVEDEKQYRDILQKKFEGEGFNVKVASNGQEALNVVSTGQIDLILLDLLMPTMDGITFYYHLVNTLKKQIPTIILTNLSQTTYKTDIKDFLVKANVSLDDVVGKVKKHLEIN